MTGRFASLLLAAFAASVLMSEAQAADAATPAACPTQPVRVVRSRGPATDYLGSVPGIPQLCRERIDGREVLFYYGSWRSDWPGAGEAFPAIHAVINGAEGARASFITRSVPGWQWRDTLINEGHETVAVGGTPHDTLRVAHEREGIEGNTYHSIITVWRDVATGVSLQVVEHQIAGQSYGPDTTWTATGIEPLTP